VAIVKLVSTKCNREAYWRIRSLKGLHASTSISQVEISGLDGPQLISECQAVEATLCQSLSVQFTKAHGSPFLHLPLLQDMGCSSCGLAATAILEGTYQCPLGTEEYTHLFVEALCWPTTRPGLISTILSPEAFCLHLQKVRKHMSSFCSRLQFGHYKLAALSSTIAHLHTRFMLLVFMTGISLSHYQYGLQVILKKVGAINVDLLQAILLMEADFNAAMKILIGHQMICNAIKSWVVPQECFGSLPEHTVIQVSLNQCLITDTSCQCHSTLVLTSVDCLTCYNSVGHALVSLACQHLGAPLSILCTIFQTIQLMTFFLQTAYGDLDSFYSSGSSVLPFQGVCQGNRAGPTIWLATSMALVDMVCTHGHPVSFHSPILHQPTELLGLLYVNDCDLFVMDSDGTCVRNTINQLQQNIGVWQGGLAVTGNALSQKNPPGVF